MSFERTKYIIIGGTSGMGRASALALESKGAKVLVVGKDQESCDRIEEELTNESIVMCANATDPDTMRSAIERAHARWGRVDGLFHVAGGSGRKYGDGPLHELTLEGWNKTMELNLTSLMLSNQAMVQYFLEHKQKGKILNMSSVLAYSPSPEYFVTHAYAAAKSAIIGFSKSIAAYYGSNDICVNIIAPGLMSTPMAQRAMENDDIQKFLKTKQPLDGGRAGMSDDIVNAVLMFLAPYSNFITGQVLAVDGGWSVSEGQY